MSNPSFSELKEFVFSSRLINLDKTTLQVPCTFDAIRFRRVEGFEPQIEVWRILLYIFYYGTRVHTKLRSRGLYSIHNTSLRSIVLYSVHNTTLRSGVLYSIYNTTLRSRVLYSIHNTTLRSGVDSPTKGQTTQGQTTKGQNDKNIF